MNAIEFKPDEGDKGQFPGLGDGQYIPTCTTSEARVWYELGSWTYPNQIEYSTDDQKTWIMEREFGASAEQVYMLTDAGEYPFYIRVTNEACGTVISEKLTAKITPRDLSAAEIALEPLSGVTAYYTGSPVLPTNWDGKITDSGLSGEHKGTAYTLVKGKDFTVSGSNNTEVTDKAGITFTGTGNYTGTRSAEFAIAYAFTTAQTTGSKNFWYKQPVQVQSPADADVTEGSADAPVLYTTADSKTTPGESLAFYDKLEDAVNDGVARGYVEGHLRLSVVADPLRRGNTNNNTPAILHLRMVPGDQVDITVAPKGFGSENMTTLRMFNPSVTQRQVEDHIVECVAKAGSNPCPPVIVGVGLGGVSETAAELAKRALLRPVGEHHPDPYYAEMESRILERVNALGIGPQGLGGTTTALWVSVNTCGTHIAGMPCAVNLGCHVTRHAHIAL